MLEIIWLIIMVCAAALCAWQYVRVELEVQNDENPFAQAQWLLASLGAMLMGLYLSWGGLGSVFLSWLQASLPQAGTDIANFTAHAIVGVSGLALVAGIPFGFVMFFYFQNGLLTDPLEDTPTLGRRLAKVIPFPKR